MTVEVAAAVGFLTAGGIGLAATPVAMRVANGTDFLDRPRGYRRHDAPTPLLGGAAVLVAFLVAALVVGGAGGRLAALLACAAVMWLVGTIDDRIAVAPAFRVLAEVGAAIVLYEVGLGWDIGRADGVQVILTVVWVIGLVNAFNLMDNMDGACATVACACGAGIGTLAAVHAEAAIAGMAFAISGACGGFLRYNLARPAKIFLGDGGSMPVGLLVAGLAMATARHLDLADSSLLVAALLVGVPMLDTALVSVSRLRRRVTLVTGGRDHLTHRLLLRLGSPRAVAAHLALLQLALCGAAIGGEELGSAAVYPIAAVAVAAGIAAISVLDSSAWRPPGIAVGAQPATAAASPGAVGSSDGPELEPVGMSVP
jgi:UDP-GlcNAc:undecaprenyl-phosphate/decaprenyl-phosphate GlcNAc-1-phosphate transferase